MDPPDDVDQRQINDNAKSSFPWFYVFLVACLALGVLLVHFGQNGSSPPS